MANKLAGFIAVLFVVVFLGFYIYKVPSIPLGIIIFGVIIMIVFDFYESLASENGDEGN
ncbi:MAG: hypothetical protein QGI11_16220 [Nitrospinota bacterium]|jgi:hypothetical protein|nr:hypothetical protein [Nitrospinota bacterium]MDP7371507.1 hypothetical protein [Nitrospinota bacterium]MDP7504012.1 hypothetical protein [Nitrospinota bacterium]MDP7662284.1 hypothetical protein [Nitrospinota bacterium]|tara:strand:- start:279 stop:455 length:177 start_codon:yes stop_codon:yes gene_type:complete